MSGVILGQFELTEWIGKGGMGHVWEAVHREQGTPVAVKVITPKWARESRFVDGLRREVEAVARLDHVGVVRVFDFGEVPYEAESKTFSSFVSGSPYVVMEHLPGGVLRFRPDRTWTDVRDIVARLLDALAHAHARGVIHRDIKPPNVLLDADGKARLTDFGLARVVDNDLTADPMSGTSGTPRYMAPEQILGEWREQGPWTDLYSLACVVHYLLRGRPPYDGSVEEVFDGHLKATPPRIADDTVPPNLDDWLGAMLAKKPTERFRRAADALYALLELEDGGDVSVGLSGDEEEQYPTLTGLSHLAVVNYGRSEEGDATVELSLSDVPMSGVFRPSPPPCPTTWRTGTENREHHGLHGVGLGLYGMRPPPLVGRQAERDTIWQRFAEVHRTGQPRAVLLRGNAGTGKSRLMQWVAQRAHELGAATVLQVVHSPLRGANDGLGPAISSQLRLYGLTPGEKFRRIRDFWLRFGATAIELFTCEALTQIVVGDTEDEDVPRVQFSSPAQRWSTIAEFLSRIARERPVFLWLDDVQWGADALGLCRYILDHADEAPNVFVGMTVRNEALRERPQAALRLDSLSSDDACTVVQLEPLDERERMRLVSALLGLGSDAARQVAERTGGNPLFAVQLVGDWIQRGVLELREDGFGLAPGVTPRLPDDIHELWSTRMHHLLSSLPDDAVDRSVAAIELAAALGQEVDEAEWRAVLSEAGFGGGRELVARLVSQRLAMRTPHGWSFAHGMFRESLERQARSGGRWRDHHEVCARVLRERLDPPEKWVRVAGHLLAAEQWEQAMEPLLAAARGNFLAGEYETAIDLLTRFDSAAESANLPADSVRRARSWVLRARLVRETETPEAATELVDRAEPIARRDDDALLAEILATKASLATVRGELDEGRALVDEALKISERLDDPIGKAEALRLRNWLQFWSGDLDGARDSLERARLLSRRAGDIDGVGWCHYELAALALHEDQLDRAAELTESALECFMRGGNRIGLADCYNMRGEVARHRGELDIAMAWYEDALSTYEHLGHKNATVARENLGLTLLASREYELARSALRRVLVTNERLGRTPFVLRNCAELLACHAALRDVEEWDETFARLRASMTQTPFADVDTATSMERAAQFMRRAGEDERADRALTTAHELWGRLNRTDRQDALDLQRGE